MEWLFGMLGLGAFASSAPLIILGFIIFFYFRQSKGQGDTVPPLDLVDAKKLDDLVSKQAELALKPLLQSNGYSEVQIAEILTRTSATGKTFRR